MAIGVSNHAKKPFSLLLHCWMAFQTLTFPSLRVSETWSNCDTALGASDPKPGLCRIRQASEVGVMQTKGGHEMGQVKGDAALLGGGHSGPLPHL